MTAAVKSFLTEAVLTAAAVSQNGMARFLELSGGGLARPAGGRFGGMGTETMGVGKSDIAWFDRRSGLALAAGLLAASLSAAPALAHGPDKNVVLGRSLDVAVTGRIASRCMLSGGGDIDLGELRGGEGAQAAFVLDCNVPFDIDVRSARGGLAHVTKPGGEGPFAGLLEYDMRLVVPTVRPAPATVEGRYTSRELMARRTLSSGDGISAGGGLIEFQMRRPEGAGLLAGRYTETVTLTVTPRM